jgi:DNA-binding NtrC family response regulator
MGIFDEARRQKGSTNATTADHGQARAEMEASGALGLVCLASMSKELGTFIALGDEASIGRGDEARVQLPSDLGLSRMHCTLTREASGGAYTVTDAGSRNGTFVDGAKITRARLASGGLLRAGDSLFMLRPALPPHEGDPLLLGVSDALAEVVLRMKRYAKTELPILVTGETGTGKELVAARVHALSGRRGALVPVNAAAIAETLAEATFFGHTKGAFSGAVRDQPGVFEQAAFGTLFLDEIGELSPILQAKLLRVLEGGDFSPVGSAERRVSTARVVAATNRDLKERVDAGAFRADLYARLCGAEITLPPLRERSIDVPWLVRHFADGRAVSAELMEKLMRYGFPLNVRELRQRVLRMLAEAPKDGPLGADLFTAGPAEQPAAPEPQTKEELEDAVRRFAGNVVRLAKHYGRTRKQIYRWCERFGVDLEQHRK